MILPLEEVTFQLPFMYHGIARTIASFALQRKTMK